MLYHLEASLLKHARQGLRVKQNGMLRCLQPRPAAFEQLEAKAIKTWHFDDYPSRGREQATCPCQRVCWVVVVFEEMPHRDQIELARSKCLRGEGAHAKLQRLHPRQVGKILEIHPACVRADFLCQQREKRTRPTAEVEHPAVVVQADEAPGQRKLIAVMLAHRPLIQRR